MGVQVEPTSLPDVASRTPGANALGSGARGAGNYLPYYVLFFISGIPALLYQIVWERALFTFYGVNIESVTITVTAFMVGLGIGSLAGGRLSTFAKVPLLAAFGGIEIGIGLFGFFSMGVFHRVATWTAGAPTVLTGVVTMGLLIIPTLLMGSTLPLLVAYCVRFTKNVGQSVGALYSVNTFGSATACLLAVFFVMRRFGESGSVRLAAMLNFVVGTCALLNWALRARQNDAESRGTQERRDPEESAPAAGRTVGFGTGMVLAAVVGFISLAYEIVWYRVYSFASGGTAPSFALLLAFYLGGIGYGSLAVENFCRRRKGTGVTIPVLAAVVLWGGVAGFLVAPGSAALMRYAPFETMLALVFIGAGLLGAAFPLLSHAAIRPEDQTGRKLSYLYLANIAGSASGSFLVGFVLMNYWGVRTICVLLLAASTCAGIVLLLTRHGRWTRAAGIGLAAAAVLVSCSGPLFSQIYAKLLLKDAFRPNYSLRYAVENRSGVIAVTPDDVVFGGGMYDGRFNTDLVNDTNAIVRAFAIGGFVFHRAETLMIGLSSGSWAQIIANDPEVKHLTIVEINPGYLSLIPKYPEVASLLHNPKVTIVIDDGRRWLVRNPQRRFDLVVMNTTFNFRANITNLLSVEFLRLARAHLKGGGVVYYNTTKSAEVFATALTTFPYALRVLNFVAVSDSPIQVDRQRWEESLRNYRIDGHPVLDSSNPAASKRLNEILAMTSGLNQPHPGVEEGMEGREGIWQKVRFARIITDDNMGTEWK